MIVRTSLSGHHIIFHAAHGLLSGKIASQIHSQYQTANWFETILATSDHDDRQLNFNEKNYLSEQGLPINFTEDKQTIKEQLTRCIRVMEEAEQKSSWVYVIISMHLEFLYSSLRNSSVQFKEFLDDQEIARQKIIASSEFKKKDYEAAYDVLRFCDRLSLILCMDQIPSGGRQLEINCTIQNRQYFISRTANGNLKVSPWPFAKESFDLSVEERLIEKGYFKSNKEFEKILKSSQPRKIEWTLTKLEK